MRILHVTSAEVRGGLMTVLETLAREQSGRHEVTVLSPIPPDRQRSGGCCAWFHWRPRGNSDVSALYELRWAAAQRGADVVFVHSSSPGELAAATLLLSVCAPCIVVEHAPGVYPLRRWWHERVYSRCKLHASCWVAVSDSGAREIERLWSLEEGALVTVHNGVDAPRGVSARLRPAERRAPLVLGLGGTTRVKGFDKFARFAEALSHQHREVRWCWVGGATGRTEGPVRVEPWRHDVGAILSEATLLLVPSRVEAFGLVILEAWACATPVVASAVGGIPEVVRAGVDGVLVPPDDDAAWTDAVSWLLSSPADRSLLGAAGHQRWTTSFTAKAMAQRYEALIEELLHGA